MMKTYNTTQVNHTYFFSGIQITQITFLNHPMVVSIVLKYLLYSYCIEVYLAPKL